MSAQTVRPIGLDMLSDFAISARGSAMLMKALSCNGGNALWRARKAIEAREIIALAEMAPPGRLTISQIDLTDDLRVVCHMGVPTPRLGLDERVHVAIGCVIGMIYPLEAVTHQLGGQVTVEMIAPRQVFHPAINLSPGLPQVMCMGDTPAMRATDTLIAVYSGLAFQNVNLAAFGSMGAMNPEAFAYWQEHLGQVPLTRKAFLEP